jgi:hypothetical protein
MKFYEGPDATLYADMLVFELGAPHDCNSEVILDRDLKPFKYTEVFNCVSGETKGVFIETGAFVENDNPDFD